MQDDNPPEEQRPLPGGAVLSGSAGLFMLSELS